jgi:RimJ/RimL family protein N-acetyltransferase
MDLRSFTAQAELRDGTPVVIRAIRPEDKGALRWGFTRLSQEAIYQRFFQAKRELTDDELHYLTDVDFQDHVALVVEAAVEGTARIIGVGRMVRLARRGAPDRAEVAFTVGDPFQGRGVATLLLEQLVRLAPALGVHVFEAEVLPHNRQMLEVFEHSGLGITERAGEGVVHVELALPGSTVAGGVQEGPRAGAGDAGAGAGHGGAG